ncbi:MAG: T9SS type A sorting domain-containing protein [bacterium]
MFNVTTLFRMGYRVWLSLPLAFLMFCFGATPVQGQGNPASDTLTTGQVLTVAITTPAPGDTFIGPECEIPVEGFVTIGGGDSINVIYIIDVSESTERVDQSLGEVGDENGDGIEGTILDAEIAGIVALNASLGGPGNVEVGVIAFASDALVADVDPAVNSQDFTTPPDADRNNDGTPDIEEVARSVDTNAKDDNGVPVFLRAGIGKFTKKFVDNLAVFTVYDSALALANRVFANQPENRTNIIFFLSDGLPRGPGGTSGFTKGSGSPLSEAVKAGTIINTFGLALDDTTIFDSDTTALKLIADSTNGEFVVVRNPSDLTSMLQIIEPVGIAGVSVNGMPVSLSPIGAFSKTLTGVPPGPFTVTATAIGEDAVSTEVTATVDVLCISPDTLICKSIDLLSPSPGALICTDSVDVNAVVNLMGGQPPIQTDCTINGFPAKLDSVVNDSLFFISARIPLEFGLNTVEILCTFTDSRQDAETCRLVKVVNRPQLPTCVVKITEPKEGTLVCDSVKVTAALDITSGVPPFDTLCTINGVEVVKTDNMFMAKVPMAIGENTIIALCTVTDNCGNQVVCADTLTVTRPEPPVCFVDITSPQDGTINCDDSVKVTAVLAIEGGLGPFSKVCDINGIPANVDQQGVLMAKVPLTRGVNDTLIATCTVVDSCGFATVCRDTVVVFVPEKPVCVVRITDPQDGTINCDDSVKVTATLSIEGGVGPFTKICRVNGVAATVTEQGVFMAKVPLTRGQVDTVIATCTIVDSCGFKTVCADTITLEIPPRPICTVQITTPADGIINCDDSVKVVALLSIDGGLSPFAKDCNINGVAATVNEQGVFMATVPLTRGQIDTIIAACTVVDSCGFETVCADTVTVDIPPKPICTVDITQPLAGTVNCDDSVKVTGILTVEGGLPPFERKCDVNGIPTTIDDDGVFMATIPLTLGQNDTLIATCVVVDSCQFETICRDTVIVFVPARPVCNTEITSPLEGAIVCDTLTVTGKTTIQGGLGPFKVTCDLNGVVTDIAEFTTRDTTITFTAQLNNLTGDTTLIATCTIVDSCGFETICRDTIRVSVDEEPPSCFFAVDGSSIFGTIFDEGSGIATIEKDSLFNVELTIDPFEHGAQEVNFRLDIIDPNKSLFFNLIVTDWCGNVFECDPVFLHLAADAANRQFEFRFPHVDRYLQVSNLGLTEIRLDLNGQKFQLVADAGRAQQEMNTYVMPRQGQVTIDLVDYVHSGANQMLITYAGPAGTTANFFLIDTSDDVDHTLELQAMPEEFQLTQNFPNPFNPTTKIRFAIPEKLDGVAVKLQIFNLLGEQVALLVDEPKAAGKYTIQWDGKNKNGVLVSTGIYIYQLVAGNVRQTRRMVFLK